MNVVPPIINSTWKSSDSTPCSSSWEGVECDHALNVITLNLSDYSISDLSSNLLSGTIPKSIGNCSQLGYLILDSNQLDGVLPESLNDLKELVQLSLNSNNLEGNCSGLTEFYAAINNLEGSIPSSLGELPGEIGNLKSLQNLDLSWNNLTGSIQVLDELSSLSELNISYNSFEENAYTTVMGKESDVYSYGVVLLELISRKKALDPSFMEGMDIVSWVRSLWEETGVIDEIVDSELAIEISRYNSNVMKEVTKVLLVAFKCTERDPRRRPTMRDVIKNL
ncbi:hypothetical protein TSUD_37080 [Trifolium subterraneum]|uniref:Serine-threonine/tyrosine-protein kinase catalytic domain-containing protein n=1 Tax=Trifolium subterraneum TaxID=3900 RepID=A0A2Z6LIB3_TRISU|nr:hypothetical protein TSUD_37080 [Trifolium subterraneum]